MPISYSAEFTATISLNNLAVNTIAYTDSIDNSTNLYDAITVILKLDLLGTGNIALGISASTDNITFTSVSNESAIVIPYSSAGLKNYYWHVDKLPIFYKIAVRNLTDDALDSSGNSITYRGIKY